MEVPRSHKLKDHVYEQQNPLKLMEENTSFRNSLPNLSRIRIEFYSRKDLHPTKLD